MNSLTRSLRSGAVAATAAAAMLALTAPAALAAGSSADVTVTAADDCTSIDVSSTKDISNVVLEFADGDTQRFEDLPERETGTFAGTDDNLGEVITSAWIKSGDNTSGDGPGYGEHFEFDASDCDEDSGTAGTTTTSTSSTTTSDSGSQDNDSDEGPKGPKGDDGPKGGDGPDGDQDATVSDTTASSSNDNSGSEEVDDAANESNEVGDDTDETNGTTGTTAVANTVATTGDETADDDGELPAARVLSGVLTATAEREAGADADAGLRAADANEVRSAGLLPNTGADILVALAGALGALALGGGLLRRARRDAA